MAYSEKAAEHYRGVELQLWSGGATVLDAKLALQSAWEVPRKELLASYRSFVYSYLGGAVLVRTAYGFVRP